MNLYVSHSFGLKSYCDAIAVPCYCLTWVVCVMAAGGASPLNVIKAIEKYVR